MDSPQEPKRKFSGVWVRASLWNRKDLTWFEKCLLCQIDSFDTCFASNSFLAEHMGTSEQTVQNGISKFRSLGLIIDWGEKGKQRQITVADCVSADPIHEKSETKVEESGKPLGLPAPNPGVYIDKRVEQREYKERIRQADTIYSEYPLRVAKPAAIRAIIKQLHRHSFADLLAKTISYAKVRKNNLEFTPHPATWFNQERFNDDVSTWAQSQQPSKFTSRDPRSRVNLPDHRPDDVMAACRAQAPKEED